MKRFKKSVILVFSCGILVLNACTNHTNLQKTKSTFFLVQPAEHFPGFNGHLNWYGRKRAGDLMRYLKDSAIERIYVNAFSRTIETIDSLQKLQKIDTIQYGVDSIADNIFRLLTKKKDLGRKVLIVCPSKDINEIAHKLGAPIPGNPEHQDRFNEIYRIHNDHGEAAIKKLIYGSKPMLMKDTSREKTVSDTI